MSYDLVQSTENFMTRKGFRGDTGMHFYPSEGSVKVVDANGNREVLGNCLRASYFRCVGEQGAPYSVRTQFIFSLGKHVEDMLVEIWKKMGIYEARSVKFYNPDFNVSGELDVVLRNPLTDALFGVEVKSFYGYFAGAQIMGTKRKAGVPKSSQLLQTLIYAKEFEGQLDHFKMWYQERGDGQHRTFDVRAVPAERNGDIIYLPEVDGEILLRMLQHDQEVLCQTSENVVTRLPDLIPFIGHYADYTHLWQEGLHWCSGRLLLPGLPNARIMWPMETVKVTIPTT